MSSALLSYGEAAAMVAEYARMPGLKRPAAGRVELASAAGRVLAQPFAADRDQPPFDRSTRDGYACRAAEAATHGWLALAGSIRAGDAPAGPLPPGSAWEIMTGAAVPRDADAVVMLEHVDVAAGGHDGLQVQLAAGRGVEAGENIVPRGAEARAGDAVLAAGVRLGPAHIALAAACGYATLDVFDRPRVAILATGDELVAVDATPGPGQIRNSNGLMLAALVAAAGGEPWILPAANDNAAALDAALAEAANADLFLVSGGVSAGKFDLVEEALARIGARFHFTGVRIQPGKPTVFGEVPRGSEPRAGEWDRAQPFFGLPGNPISSAATFLLFAAPVLAALGGSREPVPRFALARLAAPCAAKPGLTRFVPAACTFSVAGGTPEVTAAGSQGSGDLAAFARSNCFVVVPEGDKRLEPGAIVQILLS